MLDTEFLLASPHMLPKFTLKLRSFPNMYSVYSYFHPLCSKYILPIIIKWPFCERLGKEGGRIATQPLNLKNLKKGQSIMYLVPILDT